MSISSIVTRGYGSWGGVNDVVTRGYSIGAAIVAVVGAYGTVYRPNRLGTVRRHNRTGEVHRPDRTGTVISDRQGD